MLCRKPSIRSCLLHATVPSIPFVGTLRHIGMCGAVRSWALPVRFDRWLMLTVSHNHHPSFDASPFCSVNANSSAMYTRPSAITVTKGIPCARKSFATAKAPLRVSFTAFIIPAGSLGLPCTMNIISYPVRRARWCYGHERMSVPFLRHYVGMNEPGGLDVLLRRIPSICGLFFIRPHEHPSHTFGIWRLDGDMVKIGGALGHQIEGNCQSRQ